MSSLRDDRHLRTPKPSEGVDVALIIPLRDEEKTVELLVISLHRQTRPPDEVIFVDAGSSDRTVSLLRQHTAGQSGWRILSIGPAFPGVARNAGAAATSKEFIAFADAGTRLEDEWLEQLCRPIEEDPKTDVVFGHYEPIIDSRFKEWAAIAYVATPRSTPSGPVRGPSTASCLVRRSLWDRAGRFPPYRATEDLIFFDALERLEPRIAYTPHAKVHWQIADGWRATFRRMANYSRHNLVAGRGRYWHYAIFRNWAAAIACAVLGIFASGWFFAAALAAALLRLLKTARAKRGVFSFGSPFHPVRLTGTAAVLLLIDAATVWGAVQWLWCDLGRSTLKHR